MNFLVFKTHVALPLVASTGVLGLVGFSYCTTQRPIMLDSATTPSSKTLSFPASMLVSRQLTVVQSEQINHDTKRITFELPGGKKEVSGVGIGAAILTQHTPAGGWFPVFRPYTPVHDLDEPGVLQLLVKKYPNGKASTYLHSLEPGQTLTVRGPIPGYTYTPATTPRDLLFLAGGAGITPIYSLIKGILNDPADKTTIRLLWGVNGTRDIVLKDELESLEKRFPDRLHVTYCISSAEGKSDTSGLGSEAKYKQGHIDKTLLQDAIAQCGQGSWGDEKGKRVLLCGPPAMEEAVAGKQGILGKLGVQKNQIHRF